MRLGADNNGTVRNSSSSSSSRHLLYYISTWGFVYSSIQMCTSAILDGLTLRVDTLAILRRAKLKWSMLTPLPMLALGVCSEPNSRSADGFKYCIVGGPFPATVESGQAGDVIICLTHLVMCLISSNYNISVHVNKGFLKSITNFKSDSSIV